MVYRIKILILVSQANILIGSSVKAYLLEFLEFYLFPFAFFVR